MHSLDPSQTSPRKRLKLSKSSSTPSMPQLDGPAEDHPPMDPVEEQPLKADDEDTLPKDAQLEREIQVGITEYVDSASPGFSGILKKRYTDFLVNEILPSGKVLHLESLTVPRAKRDATSNIRAAGAKTEASSQTLQSNKDKTSQPGSQAEAPKPEVPNDGIVAPVSETVGQEPSQAAKAEDQSQDDLQMFKVPAEDQALLATYFNPKITRAILIFNEKILESPMSKPKAFGIITSEPISDRALRTTIHREIRRIFSSRLETTTNAEGEMIISCSSGSSSWGTREKVPQSTWASKGKLSWQELGGQHLHFTLYKENKDTMEVVAFLARQLKMYAKDFQFAGTKDRRGVTVQRVSVHRVYADRLAALNKTLRGAKLGGYEYHPRGLELGDLQGNDFTITLRDCSFPETEGMDITQKIALANKALQASVASLKEKGFINYYGLQRFGTFSTGTDIVGVKMLQEDFKSAVKAILSYRPEALEAADDPVSSASAKDLIAADDKARARAIQMFNESGMIYPALDILPGKFSAEHAIIRHLGTRDRKTGNRERENDFQGALHSITRNLRLMYVHAYQSLVWNVVASERWRRWGSEVVEGDLILINEHASDEPMPPQKDEVDDNGEIVVHPAAHDRGASMNEKFERARPLFKEEASSGKYSIFDIVLPTPGYDVAYPENELHQFYKDFMASERGGGLDPHSMRRSWKDISLSGSYRKFIGRVGPSIGFEVKRYTGENEPIVETDLEKIQKANKMAQQNRSTVAEPSGQGAQSEEVKLGAPEDHSQDEANGKIAVVLKMQLRSSQYATMALRELMKHHGVQTYKPDYGGGR
ncbi:MAG: hypothetical protein M1829_003147 [Trizodia sp. TS-e1964]|nr:MAG: hypothetical protein M1829_003147 [Trizodia sp. TS-e1964]